MTEDEFRNWLVEKGYCTEEEAASAMICRASDWAE